EGGMLSCPRGRPGSAVASQRPTQHHRTPRNWRAPNNVLPAVRWLRVELDPGWPATAAAEPGQHDGLGMDSADRPVHRGDARGARDRQVVSRWVEDQSTCREEAAGPNNALQQMGPA